MTCKKKMSDIHQERIEATYFLLGAAAFSMMKTRDENIKKWRCPYKLPEKKETSKYRTEELGRRNCLKAEHRNKDENR
jgi:hypothetical protein